MGVFSSISNNAMQAINNSQAMAGRPNVGMGQPGMPDYWLGPAPLPDQTPMPEQQPPVQMQPPQQSPVPGFQTTWQMLGYKSLEEMQAAMDPGFRNNPNIRVGPMPLPELTPMPEQQPPMQMPIQQPPMQMLPPGLPTGSAPGGKSQQPEIGGFLPTQETIRNPNASIGFPGSQQQPAQFTGGLRPAPSNLRLPKRSPIVRSGGIMRRRSPR